MNVIFTVNTSREDMGLYTNETISLVEQFGIYAIITCQKITGYLYREDIVVNQVTSDYSLALKIFKDYCTTR